MPTFFSFFFSGSCTTLPARIYDLLVWRVSLHRLAGALTVPLRPSLGGALCRDVADLLEVVCLLLPLLRLLLRLLRLDVIAAVAATVRAARGKAVLFLSPLTPFFPGGSAM
jgi:hypothetical protein